MASKTQRMFVAKCNDYRAGLVSEERLYELANQVEKEVCEHMSAFKVEMAGEGGLVLSHGYAYVMDEDAECGVKIKHPDYFMVYTALEQVLRFAEDLCEGLSDTMEAARF